MRKAGTLFPIFLFFVFSSWTVELTAQTISENASGVDSTKLKYAIDNCLNQFDMNKTVKTDVGYQYWFVDKDLAGGKTLKLSVVAPHSATHVPHIHLEDEIFFILEGTAEVYLKGEWKAARPNTSFYCPSNVEHGIRNPGETELKYLVIKKYEKK